MHVVFAPSASVVISYSKLLAQDNQSVPPSPFQHVFLPIRWMLLCWRLWKVLVSFVLIGGLEPTPMVRFSLERGWREEVLEQPSKSNHEY